MSESFPTEITDNGAGGLAYLTFIPAILLLTAEPYKSRPYVRFHAFQSIFLYIAAFILWIAVSFALLFGTDLGLPGASAMAPLYWMGWIIVFVVCAISALNGKHFKLPIIGPIANRMANNK